MLSFQVSHPGSNPGSRFPTSEVQRMNVSPLTDAGNGGGRGFDSCRGTKHDSYTIVDTGGSMENLHDGDLFQLSSDPLIYAEFIHTKMSGKAAFRITNEVGIGVCVEVTSFEALRDLLQRAIDTHAS